MDIPVLPIEVEYIRGNISVQKINPSAELPYKEDPTHVAYELTLVGRTDGRNEDNTGDVNYFNTGLRLCPPRGYYLEFLPTPTLEKHGYMLPCSTKIVNPNDRGELTVGLYKFKEGDDIELPFRAIQLILRKAEYCRLSQVGGPDEEAPRVVETYDPRGGRRNGNFAMSVPASGRGRQAGRESKEDDSYRAPAAAPSRPSKSSGNRSNHMY